MSREFRTFTEFYPHYLREHAHPVCRRLHFVGTSLVVLCLVSALWTGRAWFLLGAPIFGYGFAWIGHFFFERNRPATFHHPLYSFIGDWAMYRDMLTGRLRW